MSNKPVQSVRGAKSKAESDLLPELHMTLEEILEEEEALMQGVKGEFDRISDDLIGRIRAVFLSLGVEIGNIHLQWRPADGVEGLQAKLAQVEIHPEVKANL